VTDTRTAEIEAFDDDVDRRARPAHDRPVGAVDAPQLTRSGRIRKWDREPTPHDWRWLVGTLGKVCIALGVLMFGFVAYQLWGTGIETARAQRGLESDFEELLAQAPPPPVAPPSTAAPEVVVPDTNAATDASSSDDAAVNDITPAPVGPVATEPAVIPVENQVIPEVERGDALARLEIPAIGVDNIVVAGVSTGDLKKGPGHFPDTPLPGQLGNAAIAGHRTTYGQPFHNVDKLETGDEIVVTTLNGTFTYRVTGQQIVSPSDYQVVATTDPSQATLTLTSCHPKWTAQQRIVIFSELDDSRSGPVGEPVLNYGEPAETVATELPTEELPAQDQPVEELPTEEVPAAVPDTVTPIAEPTAEPTGATSTALASEETTEGIADAFAEGWFSDPNANTHVGFWGIVLGLIAVAGYALSRRFRNDLIGLAVGILPFVFVLYFFFQNVNRLLPPNL
jgi:sortase A